MSAPERSLLERVEKLLALATSPNPHEAVTAARLAQALVSKHRLEAWLAARDGAAVDPDPITDGREAPLEVGRRLRKWKRVLAAALAEVNGASAWVLEAGREERLCVIGRERDRAAVRALYLGLVKRIEWCSATAGQGRDRRWHEAFRIGVADAIAARLAEAEAEVAPEIEAPEGALVPYALDRAAEQAALEAFVRERFGPPRGGGVRVDARAYERGRDAGARLVLPPKGD